MPNDADLIEIDKRIAIIRDNIRQLIEEAAAFTGAADEIASLIGLPIRRLSSPPF